MMSRKALTLLASLIHGVLTIQAWAPRSTLKMARRAIKRPHTDTRLFEKECNDETLYDVGGIDSTLRRHVLASSLFGLFVLPQPSNAGEVGARINQAVTQSDLGVSVRRSVVRGAQIADKVDGQWEKLSDRFGLGSERSKQAGRPKPKVIPEPKPLDSATAQGFLDITDKVFLSLTGIRPNDLAERIAKVDVLVRPSFERTGLELSSDGKLLTGAQFNYASYVHFRAYGDYMVESNKPFPPFYREFEKQVGQQLLALLSSTQQSTPEGSSKQASLEGALRLIDVLCETLVSRGLVAATERSEVDPDLLADWVDDLGEFQLSVALDGDVTLGAQILLQEQGFRLYPTYGRFAVKALLNNLLPNQKVTAEDYYMDTNYNSDPDLFEVKEVLLNVVIENQ